MRAKGARIQSGAGFLPSTVGPGIPTCAVQLKTWAADKKKESVARGTNRGRSWYLPAALSEAALGLHRPAVLAEVI